MSASLLADLLEAEHEALLRRWTEALREHLSPGGESYVELRDHIPDYLREVVAALRGEAPRAPDARAGSVARAHGAQRFRLGFSLDAVVREYGLLRALILDLVEQRGCPVSLREVRVLTDFIATGIAEGVEEHTRRSERAHNRSEQQEAARLTALFEQAPAFIAHLHGPTHVFDMANSAYVRLMGGRSLLGKPIREALPELEGQPYYGLLDRVYATGEPFTASEMPALLDRRGDGTVSHVLVDFVFQPTRGPDGSVSGILIHAVEVTEQVRVRQQAEAARAELEAIFQSLPDAVYVGNLAGIQRANAAALSMLGYDSVEELNRHVATLAEEMQMRRADTGAIIPVEDQAFTHALQGRADVQEVRVLHQKTGEERVVRSSAAPILVGERVVGAVAINSDITERLRTEQALARERAQLLAVLENAPVAIILVDASGRLLLANRRAATELRQSTPAIRGPEDYRHWTALRPDGAPLPIEDYPLSRGLRGHSARGELLDYRFPDGSLGTLEASYGPVYDAQGHTLAALVIFADVTERRRAEAAMRERAAFEQQLIGIVSHDLRSPLNAILLATHALLRREDLDARTTKSISRIQTSAERATRLVRDLLDFTQARLSGGLRLQRRVLDLHETVRAAVDEVAAAHPERTLQLHTRGEGRGHWDGDRLTQLVTNLVVNAVKYSPEDTPVMVRTVGDPDAVTLEVHNRGAPIPEQMFAKLFQPLQRGEGQTDTAQRSVGLGLYIVEQVARAHGGRVAVRSTEEEGTTFTVQLPRGPLEPAGAAQPPAVGPAPT